MMLLLFENYLMSYFKITLALKLFTYWSVQQKLLYYK